jgi:(p)ppGpp synthase/HD superfamily hydrolase
MLTDQMDKAFTFARKAHQKQLRNRTTIPYLSHLMSVSALTMEHGGDEDIAIAALLHDTLEDCGDADALSKSIQHAFGDRVLRIVRECSDTEITPKPPWKERKETYINHIEQISDDALIVSMCDKLHNLRTIVWDYKVIGDEIFERFKGKREGTIWYYTSLTEKYKLILQSRPNAQLDRIIDELVGLLDWFKL